MKIIATLILSIVFQTLLINVHAVTPDYSNGILNNKNVLEKSGSITTEKYPNADEVLVDEYIIEKYKTNGTSNTWDDYYIKVLTDEGQKNNRVLSFYYTLPYSTIDIKLLEIIKPDGRITKVDIPKQSKVMIDNTQMYSNIYNPNCKILKVSIPDLQIGDIIRCVTHRKTVKTVIPNTWYDLSLFESTTPIKHITYKIIAPKKLPVKKTAILDKYKDSMNFKQTSSENNITYCWEADNVPRIFKEPGMPAMQSVVQRVLTSTIDKWETISKWYWNLCKPHIEATDPAMKEKVEELTKHVKSDQEKIENIFYYVAQKIRYMGLTTEEEAPGFEPHDVKITFNNKYGVCRDKAALLVSMLRLAGFKAYPVMIMQGPKLDKEVPLPYFNHAIVCVELKKGQYTFMDPTNENSRQLLPAYLCDRSYLVAKPDGETLKTTPIIPAAENLVDITTTGTLNEKNELNATTLINLHGINDTAYRNYFARLNNDERERFFEKILRKSIPSATLTNSTLRPANMLDSTVPISIKLEYEVPNILISGNKKALLEIPWLGRTVGMVNFIIAETGLNKRRFPFLTEIACGYNENIKINILNKDIQINSLPKYDNENNNLVEYEQNLKVDGDVLTGNNKFLLKVVEFSPEQYLTLKNVLQKIEINRRKMPVINMVKPIMYQASMNDDIIDTEILDKQVTINLKDKNNWTERYRIKKLIKSYNGKKNNSEVKIEYNPDWETVKIIEASVINNNGIKKALDKSELNIMDAAWNAGAPRYPGSKILIASLPDVEIGSTIIVEYEKTVKNSPFFSGIYNFRTRAPIDKYTLQITVPNNIKLNIAKLHADNVQEKITSDNNNNIYFWSTREQAPLKREEAIPPQWTFAPTLLLSTGNFKDYTETLQNICMTKLQQDSKVAAEAKSLVKNAKNDDDKIIKIRNFIAKNIKPAGPLFTQLPLSAISSPDITCSDGYGNAMDVALVYYSMLKAAGFKPELLLSADYTDIRQIIWPVLMAPQRTFFNTPMLRIRKDDDYIYLNDTNEYSPLGSTLHENCVALSVPEGQLFKIKPLKNKETKVEINNKFELSDAGTLILTVDKKYYGNYFTAENENFSLMRPEEKERYYRETIAKISQSAEPVSMLYTDFKEYPGIEKYKIKINNFSIINNDYCYFNNLNELNTILNLGLSERFYPYYFDKKYNLTITNNIDLPKNTKDVLIFPENKNIPLPDKSGSIKITSKVNEGEKKVSETIKILSNPSIISPEKYQNLLHIQEKISSKSNSTYLLNIQ